MHPPVHSMRVLHESFFGFQKTQKAMSMPLFVMEYRFLPDIVASTIQGYCNPSYTKLKPCHVTVPTQVVAVYNQLNSTLENKK